MEHNFLFQAMIYLCAAVVIVPVVKRLGLGSVLGYLIAGIVIGPSLLGFVGAEGQDIMHFAEFGVVMMLFLIGLELEPALLWRLRSSILGLGGLQVVVTSIVAGGIALALGLQWQTALAAGMILSMSSTAIVLQTLNEKGLMKTASGQSAFSVLLFQDIAVIPMLAVFPLLAIAQISTPLESHENETIISSLPAWARTFAVLGAVALVVLAGRYLFRYVLHFVARSKIRELFIATALLIVVGIAVLMTLVGLSPALGTFLAGVVLASSEFRHELESDIEPFKGLLLGLFFLAVGASIDFPFILSEPALVIGLVLALILIKGIILFILGKLFRLSAEQNFIFSFSLAQVGEFAFVLLSFSQQEGIMDAQLVSLLMAVVAISMAFTPLLMLLNEKFILPRVGTEEIDVREEDAIEEKNPVIIAGFGRFGTITGRFLRANGVGTTVLDIDSDRVDTLRKLGLKVYYGDASRLDILKAAGAEDAKVIVVAMESADKSLELIDVVKKHFPHLHIFSRAADRPDAFRMMDAGILHIYRETLDTSLRLGVDVLKVLGHRAYSTLRASHLFLRHDEKAMINLAVLRHDRKQFISAARESMEELENLILADVNDKSLRDDSGWEIDSLRDEVRTMSATRKP